MQQHHQSVPHSHSIHSTLSQKPIIPPQSRCLASQIPLSQFWCHQQLSNPFPKLPFELRIKIWLFAVNKQRTITVQEDGIWTGYGDDFVFTIRQVKHNAHSVPAILHTSCEVRSAALRHYELYISPRFKNKGFYINFASDTLAMQSWIAPLSLSHPALMRQ